MVVLDPERVELGGAALPGVRSITVGRTPGRLLEEWADGGAFCVFADVPRVRVTVKVVRWVGATELGSPVSPGGVATLSFRVTGDGTVSQRVTVQCVCASVTQQVERADQAGRAGTGVVQTIELRGVSSDSAIDPVVFTQAEGV
ncbi:MAG: hypothetical protein AAGH64_01555 [Planctomycetota bacterium]